MRATQVGANTVLELNYLGDTTSDATITLNNYNFALNPLTASDFFL